MRSFQFVIVVAFLFACTGSSQTKKYNWPKKEKRFSSLTSAFEVIDKAKPEQSVTFIEANLCPQCNEVKEYWQANANKTTPFYVVDAALMPISEWQVLHTYGISPGIPMCILVKNEQIIYVGADSLQCTIGLSAEINKAQNK